MNRQFISFQIHFCMPRQSDHFQQKYVTFILLLWYFGPIFFAKEWKWKQTRAHVIPTAHRFITSLSKIRLIWCVSIIRNTWQIKTNDSDEISKHLIQTKSINLEYLDNDIRPNHTFSTFNSFTCVSRDFLTGFFPLFFKEHELRLAVLSNGNICIPSKIAAMSWHSWRTHTMHWARWMHRDWRHVQWCIWNENYYQRTARQCGIEWYSIHFIHTMKHIDHVAVEWFWGTTFDEYIEHTEMMKSLERVLRCEYGSHTC